MFLFMLFLFTYAYRCDFHMMFMFVGQELLPFQDTRVHPQF